MDNFKLLESFCASQIQDSKTATATTITWNSQSWLLWPEAQRFAGWQDVTYDLSAEKAADKAISDRVRDGQWPRFSPSTGRVIGARLLRTLAVIQANDLANVRKGITMPARLSPSAQTSALLIYWCYAMELPFAETGGSASGCA